MRLVRCAVVCLVLVLGWSILQPEALAGGTFQREPTFADQVDTFYATRTTPANRQKFFSILLFVLLGGAATYAQLRGIKKVVSVD